MNSKLHDLIGQATAHVAAAQAEREAERMRAHQAEQDADAEMFRHKVESVLGKEVLNAVGPVTFHKNFLRQSMTFEQGSRTFRLRQVTGFLVQLEEGSNREWLARQFNLDNADAKDTFLHNLGTALSAQTQAAAKAR